MHHFIYFFVGQPCVHCEHNPVSVSDTETCELIIIVKVILGQSYLPDNSQEDSVLSE